MNYLEGGLVGTSCLPVGSDSVLVVTLLGQCLAVVVAFGSALSLAVTQLGQCLAAVVVVFGSGLLLAVTLLGQYLVAVCAVHFNPGCSFLTHMSLELIF